MGGLAHPLLRPRRLTKSEIVLIALLAVLVYVASYIAYREAHLQHGAAPWLEPPYQTGLWVSYQESTLSQRIAWHAFTPLRKADEWSNGVESRLLPLPRSHGM